MDEGGFLRTGEPLACGAAWAEVADAPSTYPLKQVRDTLAGLPEIMRLYALLGLNCGMTNVDIGNLKHDMVKDGYLTRRRVKTGDRLNVPTVSYKLWPETLELLYKHKSNHPTLWLVSQDGTPLYSTRMEGGKVKAKDLVSLKWKRYGKCPIPIAKFRNIASTLLGSHELYRQDGELFLGQTPKTVKTIHYEAPSQEVFDKATAWLHDKLLGNG